MNDHERARPRKYSTKGRRRGYVVSFPKCGRTWLRVMLGRVIQQHFGITGLPSYRKILKLEKLAKLHPEVPRIVVTHDDYPHWKKAGELSRDKSGYRQEPVLFLVRDPRDVIVSLYYEQSLRVGDYLERLRQKEELAPYRDRLAAYEGSLSEFLREEVGSFEVLLEYLEIWAQERRRLERLRVLRYEDLAASPHEGLRAACDHLGLGDAEDEVIDEAVWFASFENMRRYEAEGAFRTHKLRPADAAVSNSYKVRRGRVGGYRDELSAEDLSFLEEAMAARLSPEWGYQPCMPPRE